LIDTGARVRTQPFNGYGDQVAKLYPPLSSFRNDPFVRNFPLATTEFRYWRSRNAAVADAEEV